MVMARLDETRVALTERVARRVQAHGIPRASVEAAVDRVLATLDAGRTGESGWVVAAFGARSVPDLASRVRGALGREGVPEAELGAATAGQHTVVTVRVPTTARDAVERIASQLSLSLSFLSDEAGPVRA